MDALFTALQLSPKNVALYQEALTHPSAHKSQHYERLEFLGDAVIDLIVSRYMFQKFPQYKEGSLTKLRASVVSKEALAVFAKEVDLGAFMTFSRAEKSNGGPEKPSNLSNCLEALLGAIYLDLGYEEAERVFLNSAQAVIDRGYNDESGSDNPKGKLQEVLQAIVPISPTYEVISEAGPDHKKSFTVEVSWNEMHLAEGQGYSKHEAEVNAASAALSAKRWVKS